MPYEFKKCCTNCFNSETLKRYIVNHGQKGNCNYCESKNVFCIEPESLQELFKPVVYLYDIIEDFASLEDLKSDKFEDNIWDKLDMDWDVFPYYGDDFDQTEVKRKLLSDIFPEDPHHGPHYQFLHSFVEDEGEFYGISKAWEGLVKRWDEFCAEIKNNNRFFPQRTIELHVVDKLLRYLNEELVVGTELYRARISGDGKSISLENMGKPPKELSESGRANPKGIPYLYVASSPETAIAEVRPVIMDKVVLGTFRVVQKIKVVDLRKKVIGDPFRYGDRLREVVDYILFMHKLGAELSKAISPRESEIEYLPTQYLSEYIKGLGYDGIVYGSAMVENDNEFNAVIFYDLKVKCLSTNINVVYEISHKHRVINY